MNPKAPQPNDDEDNDPEEIQNAADETPTEMKSPEVNAQTEELTVWDEPPGATGLEAPRVLPEDENSIAEELVNEGSDEADREQRLAAADEDFEP